jgi:hypothetical protein
MTAQLSEILYFENERYAIDRYPLNNYPYLPREIDFQSAVSICWRGYIATWEVIKNKLFLVRLSGQGDFTMEKLFPGKDKVFAYWFTGEIGIPVRELHNYDRGRYSSGFFRNIFLDFECGVLVKKHTAVDKCSIIHNSGELSITCHQLN